MVLGYLRIYSMSADLQLEECAVRPIAARAVKMFAPQFIYKHLSFELGDFDNRVITDKKWLLFVLEQLISNAVKYTKTGRISIDMDQENVLVLRDTGVGIDPADLPRVFERGFTGRLGRQERRSTGLGLYLSKRVMEKLHNRIEVQSEPGVGTTVRLYLDRPKAAKDYAWENSGRGPAQRGWSSLLWKGFMLRWAFAGGCRGGTAPAPEPRPHGRSICPASGGIGFRPQPPVPAQRRR